MFTETSRPNPIRLLIVEDHRSYRVGLKMDLQPFRSEVVIIGEAASATDALKLVKDLKPQVVLLDLLLPNSSGALSEPKLEYGLELIQQIKENASATSILVLTTLKENPYVVFRADESGADGYIAKDEDRSGAELVTLIKESLRSEGMGSYGRAIEVHRDNLVKLTPKEREVLPLLAEGKSNAEIAECLNIPTEKTVRTHVGHIFSKLDIKSREELRISHGRPK